MKPIVFLQPANEEMLAGAKYYERQASGLGRDFLDEIEHVLSRLREFPNSGKQMGNGVRRRLARRFPFAVLYKEEIEQIVVMAVMHLRQRPNYWQQRSMLQRND